MVDADTVKKICDIYDWDGKGELDLFFLGDIMYAMGYNTTKKVKGFFCFFLNIDFKHVVLGVRRPGPDR